MTIKVKTDQVQRTLAVTKSATLGNDKFYLVEDYNTGKKYGWVKQSDVVYNTAKSPVKVNATYTIKPGVKLYTVPWGTFNQKLVKFQVLATKHSKLRNNNKSTKLLIYMERSMVNLVG